MSFTPVLVPARDSLPLKKRDQRLSPTSPLQQQQQEEGGAECDATFKAPYPYRSRTEFKTKPTSPFQPVARRVPALYQPWLQIHSSRPKPHALSAFREPQGWAGWRGFDPLQQHAGWDLSHQYQWPLPGTGAVHPSGFSPLVSERLGRPGYEWDRFKTLRYKGSTPVRQSNGREKGPYARRRDRKVEGTASATPVSGSYEPNSTKEDAPARASSEHRGLPWLLPHFGAGSLIELRDGRLRRVEHLQTEDFLLGSLACPDLRLSCCTVQSITSSSSSSSSTTSQLLILLHDLQTQELVDVYVEYPFFVRGRGWSSCSPQRTARLCGLQCRQLSVGDVCLALTPVSPATSWPGTTLKPKTPCSSSSSSSSDMGSETLKVPEGKRKTEVGRRRHCSAPELRGPGTNCM